MKPRLLYPAILLLCGLVCCAKIDAQDRYSVIDFTYSFEYKKIVSNDTVPTLYCVVRVSDLLNFDRVCLSYNNKTLCYYVRNLLVVQSEDYTPSGEYICFKIPENLNVPYVVVEVIDLAGRKYDVKERNAAGQVLIPREDKAQWEKTTVRIDSMDYIRKYHGAYIGREGKPRFRDRNGRVYIIERDYVRAE